jgi:hypothetical protein
VTRIPKPAQVVNADPASAPPVCGPSSGSPPRVGVDEPVLLVAVGDVDRVGHPDPDRERGDRRGDRPERDAGGGHHREGPQHDQRDRQHRDDAERGPTVADPVGHDEQQHRRHQGDHHRRHLRVGQGRDDHVVDDLVAGRDDLGSGGSDRRERLVEVLCAAGCPGLAGVGLDRHAQRVEAAGAVAGEHPFGLVGCGGEQRLVERGDVGIGGDGQVLADAGGRGGLGELGGGQRAVGARCRAASRAARSATRPAPPRRRSRRRGPRRGRRAHRPARCGPLAWRRRR